MPSTQKNIVTNLAALIRVGAEFKFSLNATSKATAQALGFASFGNIIDISPSVDTQKVEHVSSNRGAPRKDREDVTRSQWQFKIKSDEFNVLLQKLMLGGSDGTNFTQTVKSAVTGDTLGFSSTPAVIGNWYDLLISGARVRKVTTVTITSKVEGTDFVVDLVTGMIMFLTAQASDLVPVITAPAIVAGTAQSWIGIKPGQQVKLSGYGRLSLFDVDGTNPLFGDYEDFSCQLTLDTASAWNATSFGDLTFTCLVTDTVGNWLTRQAVSAVSVA